MSSVTCIQCKKSCFLKVKRKYISLFCNCWLQNLLILLGSTGFSKIPVKGATAAEKSVQFVVGVLINRCGSRHALRGSGVHGFSLQGCVNLHLLSFQLRCSLHKEGKNTERKLKTSLAVVDYRLFSRQPGSSERPRGEMKCIFFFMLRFKQKQNFTFLSRLELYRDFSLSVLQTLVCLLKLFQIKGVMKTGCWTKAKVQVDPG